MIIRDVPEMQRFAATRVLNDAAMNFPLAKMYSQPQTDENGQIVVDQSTKTNNDYQTFTIHDIQDATADNTRDGYRTFRTSVATMQSLRSHSIPLFDVSLRPEYPVSINKAGTSRAIIESIVVPVGSIHKSSFMEDDFEKLCTLDMLQWPLKVPNPESAEDSVAIPDLVRVRARGIRGINIDFGAVIIVEMVPAGTLDYLLGFNNGPWLLISQQLQKNFGATNFVVLCDYVVTVLFQKIGSQYRVVIGRGIEGKWVYLYGLQTATQAFNAAFPLPTDPATRQQIKAALSPSGRNSSKLRGNFPAFNPRRNDTMQDSDSRLPSLGFGLQARLWSHTIGPIREPVDLGISLMMHDTARLLDMFAQRKTSNVNPSGNKVTSSEPSFASGEDMPLNIKGAAQISVSSANFETCASEDDIDDTDAMRDTSVHFGNSSTLASQTAEVTAMEIEDSENSDSNVGSVVAAQIGWLERLHANELRSGKAYRAFPKSLVDILCKVKEPCIVVKWVLTSASNTLVLKCQLIPDPNDPTAPVPETPFILKFNKDESRILQEKDAYEMLKPEQGNLIPYLYGQFEFDGKRCLAIEYLDGIPLSQWAETHIKTTGDIKEFFQRWDYRFLTLTRYQLRHGDLVPRNIILVEGKPVLIDFEYARKFSNEYEDVRRLLTWLISPIKSELPDHMTMSLELRDKASYVAAQV